MGSFYVKDTLGVLEKLKHLCKVPSNAMFVTTDVLILDPNIPYKVGLKVLYEKLAERVTKNIPSSDLINMAEFELKNNYFEFYSEAKKQNSGSVIGTKFAPIYACIFIDKVEKKFL